MLDEAAVRDLDMRLNRIAGQLEGVRRMVREPRLCVDILQQFASVEAALKAVGDKIIQFHVERCFVESLRKDDPKLEEQTRELIAIVMRYRGR
jgi:CsoR family transcriptional regulator, copper-sensing transcriptional repressor